ncbi:HNH endonuclease [Streptomyces sp. 549]|uniref:HNH endonuclease n=1 Tax=Streptomyces sp. 549 TaxID=3049076 RepID=UPI0024C38971|nr:HNH endonuclease [Streptomyces sp. 549]MDK1473774.1 HNH endonuclease [Streptomyces sp. 549]
MPADYTRDALAAAVAEARTLSDVVAALGGKPTDGSRQYLRRLLKRWEIDTSHLEPDGVRHTASRLRQAVAASGSLTEVLRRLGLRPVGGNHRHIAQRVATLGIDTSHFAPGPRRGPRGGADRLVLGSPEGGRLPAARLRRELRTLGVPEQCAECRTGPSWNGMPLRLQVDHVSGKWWDNRPENLRFLCPNCHSTTDTYRGRKRRAAAPGGEAP